jgi:uncharacterized radical SAM superfamily protein
MHPALSQDELLDLGTKVKNNGAKGVLVSGGCLPNGSVPLDEFVPVLEKFKRMLGLTVFVHTGIIGRAAAFALKSAGIDAALIDVIGSAQTVEKIYNLKVTVQDYADSLIALKDAGLPLVPHVIVGLNEGRLDGELQALQMIQKVKPSALVIVAFMPIRGTAMAKVAPPQPFDIAKVLTLARLMPETLLSCCMHRRKNRSETDVLAVKAGVDAVAFPVQQSNMLRARVTDTFSLIVACKCMLMRQTIG